VCAHTFGAPPGQRPTFQRYQRLEAFAARTGHRKERPIALAARLGVHARTLRRWEAEWKHASAVGRPWVLPEGFDYEAGRKDRAYGKVNSDHYVVLDVDRERFIRASIGEMRHGFRRRGNPLLDDFDVQVQIALDRRRSLEERMAALSMCRVTKSDAYFE
jgi:hypothetical protein